MGFVDRLIRLLVAVVLTILYYMGVITGTIGIVALIVALVFTITSLVSFCPLYTVFGLKTCKKGE